MINIKIKKYLILISNATLLALICHKIGLAALPLPDVSNYDNSVQDPGNITSFEQGFAVLLVNIVLNMRCLVGTIAIAMIVFAGVKLATSQGNEEVWKKAQTMMIWSIVGLALIGLSGDIIRIFNVGNCTEMKFLPGSNNLTCQAGGFLKDPTTIVQRATLFNQFTNYIITFIKYLIGTLAVAMLLRTSFRMIYNTAGDDLSKDKKAFFAALVGLIVIIISDPVINNIAFSVDKSRYPSSGAVEAGINLAQGIKEVIGFTNILVGILAPLAIIMIVMGGFLYMTSAGNDEGQQKGKRIITLAIIGLLIIYGAFGIVNTFITGKLDTGIKTKIAYSIQEKML